MTNRLLLSAILILCLGAAPSRQFDYVAGQVIEPSEVKSNEDVIFAYLQAGVDTYATGSVTTGVILDGTLTNNDISSSAAIAFSKLASLTAGNLLVGNSSNVVTSTNPSGDVDISSAGAFTIQANSVALTTDTTGSYAAGDAEAGNATGLACTNCVAGTEIAFGSDAQGDVAYYNGTDWARLGAGTAGQILETAGAGANPAWSNYDIFVGQFTIDLDLDPAPTNPQPITGVGFTPRFIIFIAGISDSSSTMVSIGLDKSGSPYVLANDGAATDDQWVLKPSVSINFRENAGTTQLEGVVSSFDADGFSVNWTESGTMTDGTGTITYIAFR
jgi:hypothetical protein